MDAVKIVHQHSATHQRRLKFWARLANALVAIPDEKIVADAVLRLPGGDEQDLPTADIHTGFLVRQCYLDLMELMTRGPWLTYILTGTPGIGKTAFLLLWLRKLLRMGRKVLFEIYKFRKDKPYNMILFTPGANGVVTQFDRMGARDRPYLSDCNEPHFHSYGSAFALVASSPAIAWSEFAKRSGARNVYMPLWNDAEIATLHNWRKANVHGYAVSDEDIRFNYERWGGIARYLFMTTTQSQDRMKDALLKAMNQSTSAKNMLAVMGRATSSGTVVDRLCHMVVKQYMDEMPTRCIASAIVLADLVKIYYADQRQNLYTAVQEMMYNPSAASYLGKLFEELNNITFTTPSPFTVPAFSIRSLGAGGALDTWTVQAPLAVERFSSIESLKPKLPMVRRKGAAGQREYHTLHDGRYCWPYSHSFETADAFCLVGGELVVYQDTLSVIHPIKLDGLLEIVRLVDPSVPVRFVFRVPDSIFDAFREQAIVGLDGLNRGGKAKAVMDVARVRQYALRIPLNDYVHGKF